MLFVYLKYRLFQNFKYYVNYSLLSLYNFFSNDIDEIFSL